MEVECENGRQQGREKGKGGWEQRSPVCIAICVARTLCSSESVLLSKRKRVRKEGIKSSSKRGQRERQEQTE